MTRARDLSEIVTSTGLVIDTDTLYVDSVNNRVGIGTSSPSAKLGINASAPDFTMLQSDVVKFRSGVSGTTNGGVTGSASGDYFARTSGGKMLFSIDDGVTAHAVIDSSGNVGIGVSSLVTGSTRRILQVSTGTDGGQIAFADSTTEAANPRIFATNKSDLKLASANSGASTIQFITGTTTPEERMRIDASGNVTIGSSTLSADAALKFQADTGTFTLNHDRGAHALVLSDSDGTGEILRVDTSGNLLVGKTANDNTTQGGSIRAGESSFVSGDSRALTIVRNDFTSSDNLVDFREAGTTVGSIGSNSSSLFIVDDDTGLFFNRASNNILPYRNDSGNEGVSDDAIDLGRGTGRFKNFYLSGGVVFGDAGGTGTATSNSLDSYEEGTWTPEVSFGGATTGITYVRQEGKYRKVGNLVFIQATIFLSNKGTATGNASITGLPFSPSSVANGAFCPLGDRGNLNTGGKPVSLYLTSSAAPLLYFSGFDGSGNSNVADTNFANNTEVDLNLCYAT